MGRPIAAPSADLPERVIIPTRRRLRISDVLREWPVISVLAARDFKVKYKQSMLGPLWLVFQPLALLGAFIVAFRGLVHVDTSGIDYVAFVLAGLTIWSFFQAAIVIGSSSVITNAMYVRLTPCPRPAFPIAAILASLPAFAVTALGAIVAAVVTGNLSVRVVLLPLALAWIVLLAAGIVGVTSALAVPYRDVVSALPFVLQIGVFLTPIAYPLGALSPTTEVLLSLNPLSGVIEATRWMLLGGYVPATGAVAVSLVLTTLAIVVGWQVFTRVETIMADVI